MRPARPPVEARLVVVRVQPGAARSEVLGWQGGRLRVRVREAPEGGRANHAVAALLAEALGVPASSVELVRGGSRRDKLFRVGSLSPEAVRARLGAGTR